MRAVVMHEPGNVTLGERGEEGIARIKELTDGLGADGVVEAVGNEASFDRLRAPRRSPVIRGRSPRRLAGHGPHVLC